MNKILTRVMFLISVILVPVAILVNDCGNKEAWILNNGVPCQFVSDTLWWALIVLFLAVVIALYAMWRWEGEK